MFGGAWGGVRSIPSDFGQTGLTPDLGEKSVKIQLAPISTKLLLQDLIHVRRSHAKIQTSTFKNGRDERITHRQPYHYPAFNKKVVELGRPGQMVRLTPHIILDL